MEILVLLAFVAGYLVSWIQWYQPEYQKVKSLLEDLRWARSKVKAQQLDLDRWAEKNRLWAKGKVEDLRGQELPQHQNSYWRFEGPKLQQRVLDLEMELEYLRSKTVWKQD
jgi:hypothetical protein